MLSDPISYLLPGFGHLLIVKGDRGAIDALRITGLAEEDIDVGARSIGLMSEAGAEIAIWLPDIRPELPGVRIVASSHAEDCAIDIPPPVIADMRLARRLLETFCDEGEQQFAGLSNVLAPVIGFLKQAQLTAKPAVVQEDFGRIAEGPVRCSIIVPLFGRVDFLWLQQSLFHCGPNDEFIYVIDDPDRQAEVRQIATSLAGMLGRAFRVLFLAENLGFGPANNIGLAHARGDYICFLNSDVFPQERNWLDLLIAELDRDPTVGIAGPRLLFADGSVQHDGMTFEAQPAYRNWFFPTHPGKGLRPGWGALAPRTVEALTGACMVMRRYDAERAGGFDPAYVIGDFEDADLCVRVRRAGQTCLLVPRAILFHLERQSQHGQARWRQNLTLLNAGTFNDRVEQVWGEAGLSIERSGRPA